MTDPSFYRDYFWKKGVPVGHYPVDQSAPESFRVITDPYRKRISLERYLNGTFQEIVYDSNLFDFRLLKKEEESWQREITEETGSYIRACIRSNEERVILIEEAHFEGSLCRFCKFISPHGVLIATQKIHYKPLGDSFDGVILTDKLNRSILIKEYAQGIEPGEFGALLREIWEHAPMISPQA